ncbi:hypothetical protein FB545_2873 [Peribacillus frigoritolerans]|nr:hypothetical protein FB545_2873 [Peribacillus frigoritolerans]
MIASKRKLSLHAVFIKKTFQLIGGGPWCGIQRSNLTNTKKNRVCPQTMMP